MSDKFHDTLLTAILDEERFVEAVFQGPQRGAAVPWARVTIRPIQVLSLIHISEPTSPY